MLYTACIDSGGFGTAYWCDVCHQELLNWPEWYDEGVLKGAVILAKPELFTVIRGCAAETK
jgi:hypothetical protein